MSSITAYTSYHQLLRAICDGSLTVIRFAAACANGELEAPGEVGRPGKLDSVRTFCVLSALVRRTIVISRYLDTQPAAAEERNGRLMPTLDAVFRIVAQHKIGADEYQRMIDNEIDGDGDDEFAAGDLPEIDYKGSRPMVLAAELLRDFGMATHALPREWLEPVPAELRLLAARAAAAAIRPARKPRRAARTAYR